MADLIAQGERPEDRWRRAVPPDRKVTLGRSAGVWSTPWDERISRQHAEMLWRQGRLEVTRLPQTRNPLFFRGRDTTHCQLKPGEHFVIGKTTFSLADEKVQVSVNEPAPVNEQRYDHQYLRQVRYQDADKRIDALSRLPEIILGASDDKELFVRLVNVLLAGIPQAASVAVVALREGPRSQFDLEVLHWDRRRMTGEDFRPSERLIRQALDRSESVVNIWSGNSVERGPQFTQSENADWAFCTPVPGVTCRGWAIYVTGNLPNVPATPNASDPLQVRDDMKFAELAAATLGRLSEQRRLERSQASLGQFFSPLVLEALAGADPDVVLAPREATVSVLFCDLRGFSRQSEQSGDDLLGLLRRVSDALGVMTRHILEQGGVVGDFHGDAAMGFWGWPLPQDDAVERACRAALGIRAEFVAAASRKGDPLADFRMGIGIATGKAVAGKIGTVDQVKVTVFGPVVNLASRLESMTKFLRAPILLDDPTTQIVRQRMPSTACRVRRVAIVRPYGLATSLPVAELLPPADHDQLTDLDIANYEAALQSMLDGDWSRAFDLLHQVPAHDRVKDFLTVFIAQHNRTPPPHWDKVIPLEFK